MRLPRQLGVAQALSLSLGATALSLALMVGGIAIRNAFPTSFFNGRFLSLHLGLALFAAVATGLIACMVFAIRCLAQQRWRAAPAALLFPTIVVAAISGPLPPFEVTQTLVWQLEFSIARPRYDREVARIPEGTGPRALLVKDRYRGRAPWAVGPVEEIWFDESDQLGAADTSVRDRRFNQLHSVPPPCCRYFVFESRAMGDHYYLVVYP